MEIMLDVVITADGDVTRVGAAKFEYTSSGVIEEDSFGAYQLGHSGMLEKLAEFIDDRSGVWATNSNFDFQVLSTAFEKEGMMVPWKKYQLRDQRTLLAVAALSPDGEGSEVSQSVRLLQESVRMLRSDT